MTDTDKTKTDQPVAKEPKVEESKPSADGEKKVEEAPQPQPQADQPQVEPQEDSTSQATQIGTDQHGRQLYAVACSSCGNQAQVPFKPSGGRPVYCRDCYMKQRNDQRGGGGYDRR